MRTSVTVSIHVSRGAVAHEHFPTYSALKLGNDGGDARADLFFHGPADIDAVVAELVALKSEMLGDAGPRYVVNWCPAETVLDGETLYCDRPGGHPGSHHAPGPDEDSEVMWSGEPQAVAS